MSSSSTSTTTTAAPPRRSPGILSVVPIPHLDEKFVTLLSNAASEPEFGVHCVMLETGNQIPFAFIVNRAYAKSFLVQRARPRAAEAVDDDADGAEPDGTPSASEDSEMESKTRRAPPNSVEVHVFSALVPSEAVCATFGQEHLTFGTIMADTGKSAMLSMDVFTRATMLSLQTQFIYFAGDENFDDGIVGLSVYAVEHNVAEKRHIILKDKERVRELMLTIEDRGTEQTRLIKQMLRRRAAETLLANKLVETMAAARSATEVDPVDKRDLIEPEEPYAAVITNDADTTENQSSQTQQQ